jgi:hypothetical protein
MNDLNPLEAQLRSWTPRAPSPKLKARLFGHPAATATAAAAASDRAAASIASVPFSWQWFAPSTAAVLIATFLLSHQSGVLAGLTSAVPPGLFATAALSEPMFSTYYVSARHSENNTPVVGLEWTNGAHSLARAVTNQLMH